MRVEKLVWFVKSVNQIILLINVTLLKELLSGTFSFTVQVLVLCFGAEPLCLCSSAEMIDKLTLTFNRTRQAVITKELIEIISGAAAL